MEWMLLPLKRYADFNGRSRRKEYWMFWLFQVIISLILVALMFIGGLDSSSIESEFNGFGIFIAFILGMFVLAMLIPNIAVAVRRFHDQDKSGWMYLLSLIPYIGGLIIFIFMLLPGTYGPNQYGEDTKLIENVDDIFG